MFKLLQTIYSKRIRFYQPHLFHAFNHEIISFKRRTESFQISTVFRVTCTNERDKDSLRKGDRETEKFWKIGKIDRGIFKDTFWLFSHITLLLHSNFDQSIHVNIYVTLAKFSILNLKLGFVYSVQTVSNDKNKIKSNKNPSLKVYLQVR